MVFAVVFVVAVAALYLSGIIALRASPDRERLRVVRFPEDLRQLSLPEVIRSLGERVPWRLLIGAAAVLLGIFVAVGEASNWDIYLKAIYGVKFGITEPAFGKDAGFYVFTLPLLTDLRDLALLLIFLSTAIAAGVYWARGALDFREAPPRISAAAVSQFSVLLGLFFLQRAYTYWLNRFDLLFHTDGVVYGFRYVDDVLWRPGFWLLIALSIAAAILCFSNLSARGARRLVAAAVIVFAPGLILNLLQPVMESLRVKPDELRIEKPYLAANIKLTRHAYQA